MQSVPSGPAFGGSENTSASYHTGEFPRKVGCFSVEGWAAPILFQRALHKNDSVHSVHIWPSKETFEGELVWVIRGSAGNACDGTGDSILMEPQ